MKNKKILKFAIQLFNLFLKTRRKRFTSDHVLSTLDTDGIKGKVEFVEGSFDTSLLLITMRIDKELLK